MLGDLDVTATVAVKDMDRAKRFYEDKLGLEIVDHGPEGVTIYRCGHTGLLVYNSKYAGTNQATSATWSIDGDVDEIVQQLKKRGVTFEHYNNIPGVKLQGDVHLVGEEMKGAWFKDPDGNIFHIVGPAMADGSIKSGARKTQREATFR